MKVLGANFNKAPLTRKSKEEITIYYAKGWFNNVNINVSTDLVEWEQITEGNKQKFGATMGWGFLGAVLAGPLGAVAGAFLGGRKKKVAVACTFTEDRRCALEMSPDEFVLFQSVAPAGTNAADKASMTATSASDTADALLKLKQLLDAGVLSPEEYNEKRAALVAKL